MFIAAEKAAALLRNGKVVAVPTETVYGLAAIAANPNAVAEIFAAKNRPADNPLICHFHSIEQVRKFVTEIPAQTELLMQHFTPGPVSFMLNIADDSPLRFATCGRTTVIVRIPHHPVLLNILRMVNEPLAAPSANTSGTVSPTSSMMVEKDLGNKISGIVDGGNCTVGIESTIIDARTKGIISILRPGVIGEKEIREVLPLVNVADAKANETTPGSKYRHYAPRTPVFLSKGSVIFESDTALISFTEFLAVLTAEEKQEYAARHIVWIDLGSVNDLGSVATSFYKNFSLLDELKVKRGLYIPHPFPPSSLAVALQNRLEKIINT